MTARRPLRVLFVDHTAKLGGGELALLHLVRHLDRGRVEPTAVLFEDGPLRAELVGAGVPTRVLPLDASVNDARKDRLGAGNLLRVRQVAAAAAFVGRLARLIGDLDPDVVHTNSLKADVLGGLAGRRAGRAVVWHVRDRIAGDYLPPAVAAAFRAASRVVPHAVIANSHATLAALGDGRRSRRRAAVVHGGVDLAALDATAGAHLAPGAPADPTPTVGIVGRIAPWKGQHVFVEAAGLLARSGRDVRFEIVGAPLFGEADYLASLRARVGELGLSDRVRFAGFRRDAARAMLDLSVVVHASTSPEPFGQVVAEAMALRRPVVASDCGGPREIVEQGVSGLLVQPGDPAALAAAIGRLLDDPPLARRLADAGRARVEAHFTARHTARGVEAVYDRLAPRVR